MPKRHFSKTRKTKRRIYRKKFGGEGEYDIEQGPVIPVVPLRRIPTDPVKWQEELGRRLTTGISSTEAESVFSGPNPEERQRLERSEMNMYDKVDPDVAAYTDYSDMPLFSEGGRRKTRRIRRKSRKTKKNRRKTKRHYKK